MQPIAARKGALREFKQMVRKLHAAGLEVILDVVYNHSAEGDELGPTLSLRGIDNAVYYRLTPGNLRAYLDFSGCGNTLNTAHPRVVRLITDSLRYWVTEMHVDGFRFDLASALARTDDGVDMKERAFDSPQPGPRVVTGQANRRALGSRRGGLPGRAVSHRLVGAERTISRRRSALLARR